MSFSTETTRLCRYHGCWRDIVTDAPSPLIGHGVEPNLNLLCDKHASQLMLIEDSNRPAEEIRLATGLRVDVIEQMRGDVQKRLRDNPEF